MMTIQRLRRFLPFVRRRGTPCRSIAFLMLLVLIVMGLPALSGAQTQTCLPDGDVDQNGSVTAQDALLTFQQALSLTQLNECQLIIADVAPLPTAPDGSITALDALCIFQKALSLPSCLDNQPPAVDPGPDQSVDAGSVVMLMGSGTDPDGEIASYQWAQTGGPTVSLSVTDQALTSFTAPEVETAVTLTFRLTVTDDDGATAGDDVSVTIQPTSPGEAFVLGTSKLDDLRYRLQ